MAAMLAVVGLAGCSDDGDSSGDGNLSVLLSAEDTIPNGIPSGNGDEEITDGYSATFDRYIIALGLVDMSQLDATNRQTSSVVSVADYVSLPTTNPELTAFNGIVEGQYTEFGFSTPAPDANVLNVNSVAQSDVDAMIANGWSYIIEGRLTRVSDGATRDFLIEAAVPTTYTACAVEDLEPGVNVSRNASVDITMHGDHLFFNGFPEEEGAVNRQAQWMWDIADTNGDEVLTRVDFEAATDIGTLFPSPPAGDYELTGGPLPINTAWDFVRAQLGTQGHIFGEGECEWGDL